MSRGIEIKDLIDRMTNRERVLMDQAGSLVRAIPAGAIPIQVLVLNYLPLSGRQVPFEIGFAAGTEREPSMTYGAVLSLPPENLSSLALAAEGRETLTREVVGSAKDRKQIGSLLAQMIGADVCLVTSDTQAEMARSIPGMELLNIETIDDEERDALAIYAKGIPTVGRAQPDAVWLYRVLRIARQGDEE